MLVRMNRLFCCLLALVGSLAATNLAQEPVTDRPNVIFVFSDDHASHAIGAYGGWLASVNPTPEIDRLAASGALFQNNFCTNSICGPSRAVILTGKHSHLNGFRHNGDRFDGDQMTFPKQLRLAGYRTALFGKWHLKSDPQGFDDWDVLPGQGAYYNPVLIDPSGRRQVEGHCTDVVTDLAIEWLEAREDSSQPFFLMCQHKAPHRTWMPALRHLGLYDDVDLPEAPTLFDEHADDAPGARFQEMEIDRHMHMIYDLFLEPEDGWNPNEGSSLDKSGYQNLARMTDEQRSKWDAYWRPLNAEFKKAGLEGEALVRWKAKRYLKNYLRCVRGVDESVGRLLDYVDANGLAENTIIVYSSDQGFYLGDHGWYDKRWMYEESMRMPLIVRWPGVTEPGQVVDEMTQNLDFAQTFLAMAGIGAPEDMQGESLVPLLRGEKPADWRDALYYHYYEYPSVHMVPCHAGVRTDRFKLIHYYQFDEWEFFDLAKDPDELTNLFGSTDYTNEIMRMTLRLGELRERYADNSDFAVMPPDWRRKYR